MQIVFLYLIFNTGHNFKNSDVTSIKNGLGIGAIYFNLENQIRLPKRGYSWIKAFQKK